jgi:hypothetical protein
MKELSRRSPKLPKSRSAEPTSAAASGPRLYQPVENPETESAASRYAALSGLSGEPGYYNAAKKAALLRRGRRAPHDELFVDFSGDEVQLALTIGGQLLSSGPWSWHATAGGQRLEATGAWSEVCWNHDKAGDYLEIELPLTGGWRLERQMFLARQDQFLFLADALLGPEPSDVELRSAHSLPLASGCELLPAAETREGWLAAGGKRRACIVPTAQPEWRAEFCHAEIAEREGRLTLEQAALGHNLFAPLWIDINAERLRRPLTWRRLTVGENLAVVPRDVAVGYRIQSGDEQWLIYRSLDRVGNRSVLGVNTVSSFAALRFFTSGKTQEIVAIE